MLPAFATPDDVEKWTDGAISADDPRLQPMLDAISSEIRAYCGWHVSPLLRMTLTLDGPGDHVVTLPSMCVVSVFTVGEKGVELEADAYEWSQLGELRKWPAFWTSAYRGLTVDLEHGFDSTSGAAAVLRSVTLSAVSRGMLTPVSGVTREQTLVSSITYASFGSAGSASGAALAPTELDALSPYRIRGV